PTPPAATTAPCPASGPPPTSPRPRRDPPPTGVPSPLYPGKRTPVAATDAARSRRPRDRGRPGADGPAAPLGRRRLGRPDRHRPVRRPRPSAAPARVGLSQCRRAGLAVGRRPREVRRPRNRLPVGRPPRHQRPPERPGGRLPPRLSDR